MLAQVVRHIVVWRTRHTIEIFVPAVDFVTAQGNVETVVTPLGVLGWRDGHLVLRERFPGIAVEEIAARTGFPVVPATPVPVLEPTEEEIRLLEDLDPQRQRDLEFPRRGSAE